MGVLSPGLVPAGCEVSLMCVLRPLGVHGRARGAFVLTSSRATGFCPAAYLLSVSAERVI